MWVRGVAVAVMVAAFVDFLMPQGGVRRFARVVMGLVLLLTIIQPVVGLLHQQVAVAEALAKAAEFLAAPAGAAPAGAATGASSEVIALTEKALARQIEGVVAAITGTPGARAEVRLALSDGKITGGVRSVRIILPEAAPGAAWSRSRPSSPARPPQPARR
jgi:stage III sporulation protein AF